MDAPRVLILSASIGEGHDLPARVIADGLRGERPGVHVRIEDGLLAMGWPIDRAVLGYRRDVDHVWFAEQRRGLVYRRGAEIVAYGYPPSAPGCLGTSRQAEVYMSYPRAVTSRILAQCP